MSTPRKERVLCYLCGESYERWRWDSINCETHKNLSEAIASGKLFERYCPSCGGKWREPYPLICFHEGKRLIAALEIEGTEYDSWMLKSQVADGQRFVRVRDQYALSEKVACMESGRDDRIVELCKIWSKNQPDYLSKARRIWHYYYAIEDGNEVFIAEDSKSILYREAFPDGIYNMLEGKIKDRDTNSIKDIHYDMEWIASILEEES